MSLQFDAVAQTVAAPGWPPVNLPLTIDGVTATAALSGYNSPGGTSPTPTPVVEYTMAVARNRVRGVRLWNQGGGIHTDADGLSPATVLTFLDAANNVLHAGTLNAGNGGAPFDTLTPGPLNGVTTVRLSQLGKQVAGTVAPLWREFQLLAVDTVYPCRRRTGALQWYTTQGNAVPAANLVPCP